MRRLRRQVLRRAHSGRRIELWQRLALKVLLMSG
jgi:hypothetical protein